MFTMKYLFAFAVVSVLAGYVQAQDTAFRQVALGGATEVVAEINGGFGTLHIRRGQGPQLMTIKEKTEKQSDEPSRMSVEYHIDNGIGYLTVDMGTEGQDDMNALACLLNGRSTRTYYMTINGDVPVSFDVTLGAGKALLDLTDIRVRALQLDAGAGSVVIKADRPNREEIGRMSISAGVGSLRAERIGNLRFNELDFEGGLGEYVIDCSGDLPDNAKVITDVGVGSLTIVLPRGVGAKALTDDSWLSSRKMYGFVRKSDVSYITPEYDQAHRRVSLDIQSGLGSVAVRWAR